MEEAMEFDFLKELSGIDGELIGVNTKSKIFDPKIDIVFKAIFAQNTSESEVARIDLLSSILGCRVQSADLIRNELPLSGDNEKASRLDMLVKLQNNEEVNVEMQLKNSDDMLSRSEYYVCKMFATQKASGKAYGQLHKAYQISILNFTLFKDNENFIDEYEYRNATGKALSGNTKIIFVELSKLSNLLSKAPEELSPLEMWSLFLKFANTEKQKDLLKTIENKREGIAMAHQILENVSYDRAMQLHYIMQLKHEMDKTSSIIHAEEKGWQSGLSAGIYQVAKNMLTKGKTIDDIKDATNLSEKDILSLR